VYECCTSSIPKRDAQSIEEILSNFKF
jgi:hypothetical protein